MWVTEQLWREELQLANPGVLIVSEWRWRVNCQPLKSSGDFFVHAGKCSTEPLGQLEDTAKNLNAPKRVRAWPWKLVSWASYQSFYLGTESQ